MRLPIGIAALLFLAACGRNAPPATSQTTTSQAPSAQITETAAPALTAAAPQPWFICDGIDTPSIFVFTKDEAGANVSIVEYDKTHNGQAGAVTTYGLGEGEGAAGSVYTPFMHGEERAGSARAFNPGMLDTPGAAYTEPFTSVNVGERSAECRWMARTRLVGFTTRRSFVITEDADGDLIYDAYSFSDAAKQQPIDMANAQRSTIFSLEVRDGHETTTPAGTEFRFDNRGYSYVITTPASGPAQLRVLQGAATIQTEPLIAFQTGTGHR